MSERITRLIVWPLTGVAMLLIAIVLLLGPWWLRIARDLFAERQARIRAEERAEMASRVHDSVLQTLALIQRRADDPQQVVQPRQGAGARAAVVAVRRQGAGLA